MLFGFLVAAPAAEWTLKNIKCSLVFVGESVCAPFCAPLQKQENRFPNQTKTEPKKQRKTNTRATHKNTPKTSSNHRNILQNGTPEGVLRGPGGSWPQGRRQEPPKISFGGFRRPPKNSMAAPGGAQVKIRRSVLPPSKPTRRSAPLGFRAFLLEIAAGASAGCKNRGVQGFRGHSWGWGEKLKLLQQQASLLFKASLREA